MAYNVEYNVRKLSINHCLLISGKNSGNTLISGNPQADIENSILLSDKYISTDSIKKVEF